MAQSPSYVLTDDDHAVLAAYARKRGPQWKDGLISDWLRAGYPGMDAAQSACLQRIRNRLGPSWLATFELP